MVGEPFTKRFNSSRKTKGKGKGIATEEGDLLDAREVTLERFESIYWQHLNSNLRKKLVPSYVFSEILTHIKRGMGSNLSRLQYLDLPSRLCQITVDERDKIYSLFEAYEKLKLEKNEFDIADFVNDIQSRVGKDEYIPQINFVYVDDVQDLSNRQIELFKSLVKDGYHLAGEQMIAQTIKFRSDVVKTDYFASGKETGILNLKHNFRTHAGVHDLSQSLIDMICNIFPGPVDAADEVDNSISGPIPELWVGHEMTNDAIREFYGEPGKVILVRDEGTTHQLCQELKIPTKNDDKSADYVLSIMESKGIEFEDVLLYNFFEHSPFKHWNVLYQFMDDKQLSKDKGHIPAFNYTRHSGLYDELKTLYVAVTRCKKRLLIVEENDKVLNPVLEFWIKKKLVEVSGLQILNHNEEEPMGDEGTSNSYEEVSVMSKGVEGTSSSYENIEDSKVSEDQRHKRMSIKIDWTFLRKFLRYLDMKESGVKEKQGDYDWIKKRITECLETLHHYMSDDYSSENEQRCPEVLETSRYLIMFGEKLDLINSGKQQTHTEYGSLRFFVKVVERNKPKVVEFLKAKKKVVLTSSSASESLPNPSPSQTSVSSHVEKEEVVPTLSTASASFSQKAGAIRKGGYIAIKNRACKVVHVYLSKAGKQGPATCRFIAHDIFNGIELEDTVPSSHYCDVPNVSHTDYQLIDISEDDYVSLLTESGGTKDDLKLPTDESLLKQIKDGFEEGKDLVVTVVSAMGEEQICAVKEIG